MQQGPSPKQGKTAPFTSKTQRVLDQSFSYTPGPGAYNMPDKLIKPILYDQFGRKRSTSQFASQSKRFKWKTKSSAPGPGQYELRIKANVKSIEVKSRQMSPMWHRLQSAPSIPSMAQKFGYHETPTGDLILQKGEQVTHTGVKNDSIGPGHYAVEKGLKSQGGTSWHRSKAQRDARQKTATDDLGPGSYYDPKDQVKAHRPQKPSSYFASSSKRISYIPEEGTRDDDKRPPGPGHYEVGKGLSIDPKCVPESMQFFGSSAARFKAEVDEFANIGPAKYDALGVLSAKLPRDCKAAFVSSRSRFEVKHMPGPGPGAYRDHTLMDKIAKKVGSQSGSFYSSEKRFLDTSSSSSPGPGHYPPNTEKKIGSHNSASRKQSSMFLSKVKRLADPNNQTGPPPGAYEIETSIVRETDKVEASFKHSPKRFKDPKSEKLGPGYYTPQTLSKPTFADKGFVNREPRFNYKDPENSPGPGEYHEERRRDWTRPSYNAMYSHVN